MARLIPMIFALVLVFGLALSALFAENEKKEFPEQSPEEKVAIMELWTKQQQQESGEFIEHFSKNWDKETDAARAAFCKLVESARAEQAIPLLVRHLEFYYSEKLFFPGPISTLEVRPALQALIEIGIPSLEPAVARILKMIDELPEKETDDSRRQAAFLHAAIKELPTKILGKDLAVAYLKMKLEDKDLSKKAHAVIESTISEITPPEENADKTLQLSDVTDYMEKVCARLEDKEYEARMLARAHLRAIRKTMADNHIAKLRNLPQKPDNSYGSPLHLTIQSIGEWRIEDAVPPLVDIIDYELDKSTLPVGKSFPLSISFPAAFALSQIADKYVGRTIIARLRTELNEKTIRICVWTLFKTYGEDVAAFMLEKEESDEKNDDAVKQRMKTAKELVAKGEGLIDFDDEETKP